ncbi:MAG: hotdog fold thioesterase [Bacteroidota bacterium]
MEEYLKPSLIIDKMMATDAFSQWLGIERITEGPGHCTIQMTTRPEMVNGFGILHGGITFSFADSAFAFASNSRGQHAVSVETSISHLAPGRAGEVLIAVASEKHLGKRLARYEVIVSRQDGTRLALFSGMVFRKKDRWRVTEVRSKK